MYCNICQKCLVLGSPLQSIIAWQIIICLTIFDWNVFLIFIHKYYQYKSFEKVYYAPNSDFNVLYFFKKYIWHMTIFYYIITDDVKTDPPKISEINPKTTFSFSDFVNIYNSLSSNACLPFFDLTVPTVSLHH